MEKVLVFCWHCGKRFYIELKNYYAGQLFCSDKCRLENMKQDLEVVVKELEKNQKGDKDEK